MVEHLEEVHVRLGARQPARVAQTLQKNRLCVVAETTQFAVPLFAFVPPAPKSVGSGWLLQPIFEENPARLLSMSLHVESCRLLLQLDKARVSYLPGAS